MSILRRSVAWTGCVDSMVDSVQGIDDTPRTPTRQKHRKASRSKSSVENDDEPLTNGLSTSSSTVCA